MALVAKTDTRAKKHLYLSKVYKKLPKDTTKQSNSTKSDSSEEAKFDDIKISKAEMLKDFGVIALLGIIAASGYFVIHFIK
jgi:hypothetical protein